MKKKPFRRKTNRQKSAERKCLFCTHSDIEIDYKNLEVLAKFITSKAKISSRRVNRNCAKHQRRVAKEIKRARFLALLPYIPQ